MFATKGSRDRKRRPWALGALVLPVAVLAGFGAGRARPVHPTAAASVVAVVIAHARLQMPDSVPAGMIEFQVTNHDSLTHGLAVRVVGAVEPVGTLDAAVKPGGTAKQQVTLAAGSYEVYCPDARKLLTHRLTVLAQQPQPGPYR